MKLHFFWWLAPLRHEKLDYFFTCPSIDYYISIKIIFTHIFPKIQIKHKRKNPNTLQIVYHSFSSFGAQCACHRPIDGATKRPSNPHHHRDQWYSFQFHGFVTPIPHTYLNQSSWKKNNTKKATKWVKNKRKSLGATNKREGKVQNTKQTSKTQIAHTERNRVEG